MATDIKVPYLNLAQIYSHYKIEMNQAWKRVVSQGWFVLGPEVKVFEKAFAKKIESHWSVGVGNGTDAIEMALRALNIGPGDEVITTPLTAMPTLMAIALPGASIRLADVYQDSGLINPSNIEQAITPKTKAVIPVHLYGQICDMKEILRIVNKHRLYLVEDCAQAHGAIYNNHYAGYWGDFAAWSFYPTKNLGAFGDAGAISSRKKKGEKKIMELRNYGQKKTYEHISIGRNSRLDELQAAILSERLKKLSYEVAVRRKIAHRYQSELKGKVTIVSGFNESSTNKSSYHLFVIVAPYSRDLFRKRLLKEGVETLVHYPIPAHLQKAFKDFFYKKGAFPASEYLADRIVSLPLHPFLTETDIKFVIKSVKKII